MRRGTWWGLVLRRMTSLMRAREDVIQRLALRQPDEEHDFRVARRSTSLADPLAGRAAGTSCADDDALDDLGKLLDLAIDLRRPDAHAAGVERRVASPVDHDAAGRA